MIPADLLDDVKISIHALLAESDLPVQRYGWQLAFLSTLSLRRATPADVGLTSGR